MWGSYSSVLAGSAIPRHNSPSHPGLCETPHAHEKEQMGASLSSWTWATAPQQSFVPTGTSHCSSGVGGPTVGCFGHRTFSFANQLSQSPNRLVTCLQRKIEKKKSALYLWVKCGKIILYTSEPSCLEKTRNEMSSWKTNCPVCFMHEHQHS